ncbi:MAG: hypothetical protein ABI155_10880 [Paralcaligenes sp.]
MIAYRVRSTDTVASSQPISAIHSGGQHLMTPFVIGKPVDPYLLFETLLKWFEK